MSNDTPIQYGEVTATYFWDDGSGINGDTGMPAGGEPMQKGLFSSPSWPLGTKGYIEFEGEQYDFFIGDRGPGVPSNDCDVLLDIDGKTFADMMGESWDDETYFVSGGNGHAEVEYFITEWGDGNGTEGAPHPFDQPGNKCENAVSPIPEEHLPQEEEDEEEQAQEEAEEEAAQNASDEQEEQEEQEEQDEAPATSDDEQQDTGVTAETAANDLSGTGLMNAEGMPSAAGLLTLAIIPAILIALAFAWFRRPSGVHAGAADDSGKGLMGQSNGRHVIASFLDRLRGNDK
ncbi:hypothetical protein [Nocardiopsis sp. MG754419]|uniref:hypothetical protein n=1 Tax=Nocardiopsis sp. MG754419 TaxID=2259865 RepID=UPI001BAB83CD|nr:hypothetical protein [Nocardiopsis sp. MG754419]MBR8742505.1 hypothetical protein [Nocardiopsis sp. MG754419]